MLKKMDVDRCKFETEFRKGGSSKTKGNNIVAITLQFTCGCRAEQLYETPLSQAELTAKPDSEVTFVDQTIFIEDEKDKAGYCPSHTKLGTNKEKAEDLSKKVKFARFMEVQDNKPVAYSSLTEKLKKYAIFMCDDEDFGLYESGDNKEVSELNTFLESMK